MKFLGNKFGAGRKEKRSGVDSAMESGGFEIEQLGASNWHELKTLKLEAVRNNPKVFGQTPEEVAGMNQDEWEKLFHTGKYFVAREGGKVIGMVCLISSDGENSHVAKIHGLYVTPSARGRGIGRALMRSVIEKAKDGQTQKIRLAVDTKSGGVIKMYEELGFIQSGRSRDIEAGDGEKVTEVEMELTLQRLN